VALDLEVDQIFKDGLPDTVTYTPNGGSGVDISAIWSGEQSAGSDYDDGRGEVAHGHVICSKGDVATPHRLDTFTIGGETWRIDQDAERWQDSNAGLITIQLVRFDREEVSGEGHRIRR
jgi:hypothetical protein